MLSTTPSTVWTDALIALAMRALACGFPGSKFFQLDTLRALKDVIYTWPAAATGGRSSIVFETHAGGHREP
jgi:hypothetical protein